MEENKLKEKKKSNIWLIVFLIILVLGLAGYICYDKFYKKEPVNNCKKEPVNNCKTVNEDTKELTDEETWEKELNDTLYDSSKYIELYNAKCSGNDIFCFTYQYLDSLIQSFDENVEDNKNIKLSDIGEDFIYEYVMHGLNTSWQYGDAGMYPVVISKKDVEDIIFQITKKDHVQVKELKIRDHYGISIEKYNDNDYYVFRNYATGGWDTTSIKSFDIKTINSNEYKVLFKLERSVDYINRDIGSVEFIIKYNEEKNLLYIDSMQYNVP